MTKLKTREKEDLQIFKDSILCVDLVQNPDSSKPTGEGEMFEIIKEIEH